MMFQRKAFPEVGAALYKVYLFLALTAERKLSNSSLAETSCKVWDGERSFENKGSHVTICSNPHVSKLSGLRPNQKSVHHIKSEEGGLYQNI